MNIVYIEDNLQDRILVQRYIDTTAHQLTTVTRLEELDLGTLSADLILLDILIDGKSAGLNYIEMFRDQGIQCPIVAVTGLALPHQLASYKRAGIEVVIQKPFEITELAEIIARYDS